MAEQHSDDEDDYQVHFEKVEMHLAFMWDCPNCGKENFQRSISRYLDPDSEKDQDMIRSMCGEDYLEMAKEREFHPKFQSYPAHVICHFCEFPYEAYAEMPGRDTDADEDE